MLDSATGCASLKYKRNPYEETTTFRVLSRDGRTSRAFTIAALATLGACADEPVAPKVSRPLAPSASQANAFVITVTNNSGGSEVGSPRWALAQATGGETR